ncbi:hypothetical protein CBF16_22895 (plasmid) [Pantoea agglomerans]|uniref:hypothetical protein n=1 Tax=Enterobacter agglomerans TaxID=549 RepID=UPI000F5E9613|nr:hypothetical protein [Pantoea agglomerans]AZI53721.1 hypothetical protein CBF16_22895 [Pantoea agglomerans]
MSKRVLIRHYTGNAINFIQPALMFMMLILPHLCFAADDDTLVSALDVKGTTGTAYWSTPNTSHNYNKVSTISIGNSGSGWLPSSGFGIVNNCSFTFTTEEGKTSNIVVSLSGIDAYSDYNLPEPINVASYSITCRATLINEGQSNIVMDGRLVFFVDFETEPRTNTLIVNGKISKGTLYTSPSCTLSVPDTAINFMGDAASFISGIRRSASFSATCEGTSSATLKIVGSGAIDTEGCLSAQKKGDFSQALRLCADGFKLDGSNSKALRMDDNGNSTGSIDFMLSSYNNEEPQPGDYTTTVYAVIAPD